MTNNIFSLNGRTALVTGASGGIGGAIAKGLYDAGANVVMTGRDIEKLERIKQTILDGVFNNPIESDHIVHTPLNQIYTLPINLMDVNAVDTLSKQSVSISGKQIDILVNAAGVYELKSFPRISADRLSAIMELNFRIPFKLCQAMLGPMQKNGFGRIINITSVSVHGAPSQAHYDASKGALTSFTKSLAATTGYAQNGITFNCIAPGFIETDMAQKTVRKTRDSLITQIPVGRFGTPEEITGAAVFLASPAASYINGQTIAINGGLTR